MEDQLNNSNEILQDDIRHDLNLNQKIINMIEKTNIINKMYPYRHEHIQKFEEINKINLPPELKFYLTNISREIRINDLYIFPIFDNQSIHFHQYKYPELPKIIKNEPGSNTEIYYLTNDYFNLYVPIDHFN